MTENAIGMAAWIVSTILAWWVIAVLVRWAWHKGVPAARRSLRSWWQAPLDRR